MTPQEVFVPVLIGENIHFTFCFYKGLVFLHVVVRSRYLSRDQLPANVELT